jgi:hypothetical protein
VCSHWDVTQSRAGQVRAGQGRASQGRARFGLMVRCRCRQRRAGHVGCRAEQGRAGQGKYRQGRAELGRLDARFRSLFSQFSGDPSRYVSREPSAGESRDLTASGRHKGYQDIKSDMRVNPPDMGSSVSDHFVQFENPTL